MIEIEKSTVKGKRYQIQTSTGDKLRITEETVFRYGIFEGAKFTEENWFEILEATLETECYDKVLGYQSVRAHTELEVKRKLLKKSYPVKIIDKAISKAVSFGILSDRTFAFLFVEEKLLAGNGRQKIRAEMMKRGVDKGLIKEAFEHFESSESEERENEILFELAKRKWRSLERESDRLKRKQKFLSFLANRGFTAEQAYRAYDHCNDQPEAFSDW